MPFDPDRFRKLYPRRPYPDVRFLSERARYAAGRRLAEQLGDREGAAERRREEGAGTDGHVEDSADAHGLWDHFDRAACVAGADASAPGFDLIALLAACDVPAPGRLVNVEWYTGDGIEVPCGDLAECFPAFWQEGADDLAVFDGSFEWVLYVTRDGEVRVSGAGPTADEAG